MGDEPINPEALFNAVRKMDREEDRRRYLDETCGDVLEIRQRVEALLRAYEENLSFLEAPALGLGMGQTLHRPLATPLESAGSSVGPYKLLEQIGEGGMAVVFLAEQTQPIHRKVAMKIIKPGMDSRQILARFDAERQALALMEHPNIAKVLDAGATASGRPYFVMELVKGVPITRYCDEHRLTPRERLELFIPVCHAIQHAHQKGIIHRDLKPTNVLVALYDGQPVPKVIDFGVAKATGQRLTDQTMFTGFGTVIGTPEYMSPEQAEFNQLDIDTRSDIYSLGVLLYELLTGTTPIEHGRVKEAALLEVLRVIREQDPPPPSTRLSTLASLPSIAAQRGLEPAKLIGLVKGELDWILMKALEKDRNRRYDTANGFARDVERYLHDEPVQACPPSTSYRLRKFARRNRPALTMAAVIAAAMIAGTVVSSWQAVRATQARELAQLRLVEVESQRREAERNFQRACDAVDQMLLEVGQESLADVPQMEPVRQALLEKALAFYKEFLAERSDDPTIRRQTSRVYRHVAGIYRLMGKQRQAEEAWREAIALLTALVEELPEDPECHRELARAHSGLGELLRDENRREEAEKEYGAALPALEKLVADHPENRDVRADLAQTCHNYAALLRTLSRPEQAEQMYLKAITLREQLSTDLGDVPMYTQELARTHFSFALLLVERNRPQEAEAAHRRAIELASATADRYPDMAECRNIQAAGLTVLGNMWRRDERYDEAEEAFERSIALARGLVSDFPRVVSYRRQLAVNHFYMGLLEKARSRAEQALRHFELALEHYQKLLAEAPAVAAHLKELIDCQDQLVQLLQSLGRHEEASQTRQKVDESLKELMAQQPGMLANRQQLIAHYRGLAERMRSAKRWAEAEAAENRAVEAAEQLLSELPTSPDCRRLLGACLRERGAIYRETRKAEEAEQDFRRSVAIFRDLVSLHPDAPEYRAELARSLDRLGLHKRLTGQPQESEAIYREAVQLQPDDPQLHNGLGNTLWWQGRLSEAEAPYRAALRLKPDFTGCRFNLGTILGFQGKTAEAEAEFREILQLRPNDASTLNALAWTLCSASDPQSRKPEEALAAAEKAVSLNPEAGAYWNTLGVARYRAGKWDEAIAALEKAAELRKGGDSHDWFFLAMAHWRKGNAQEAREWYAKAAAWMNQNKPHDTQLERFRFEAHELLQKPRDPWIHIFLSNNLVEQERFEDGLVELQKAVVLDPEYARAHFGIARLNAYLGRWNDSAAAFARALQLQPQQALGWIQGGTVFLYTGDVEAYRRACSELLRRSRETKDPHLAHKAATLCALAPDSTADVEQAMKLVDLTLSLSESPEDRARSQLTRGLLEYRAGRFREAVEWTTRSSPKVDGAQHDALTFAVLALAHYRLGEVPVADAALENARRIVAASMPDAAKGQPFEIDWDEWLQCLVLITEAEALTREIAAQTQ